MGILIMNGIYNKDMNKNTHNELETSAYKRMRTELGVYSSQRCKNTKQVNVC